ncbi:MAG: hypothetical protein ACE5FO_00790 [Parvularculaceae bacterium]
MQKALAAAFAVAGLSLVPAAANEVEQQCLDYTAEYNGDNSGCACLGEAADKDPALAEAIAAISAPEDVEAADETVRQAIAACWPAAPQ